MKKTAPNYPIAPNYPANGKKADPKALAPNTAPVVDGRDLARQEHTNHFTNRATAKGK